MDARKALIGIYQKLERVLGKKVLKVAHTMYKRVLLALMVGMLISLSLNTIIALQQPISTIGSHGAIKTIGVGVYSDSGCTNKLSSIDWGTLDPGATKNVTTYLRNEGNSAMTLSLSTSNWNPSIALQYMTLNWDYGGKSLAVNEITKTTFILKISASITGITSFSFDIIIVGSG